MKLILNPFHFELFLASRNHLKMELILKLFHYELFYQPEMLRPAAKVGQSSLFLIATALLSVLQYDNS